MNSDIITNEKKLAQQWLEEIRAESPQLADAVADLPPIWIMMAKIGIEKQYQYVREYHPTAFQASDEAGYHDHVKSFAPPLSASLAEGCEALGSYGGLTQLIESFIYSKEGSCFYFAIWHAHHVGLDEMTDFFASAHEDGFCSVLMSLADKLASTHGSNPRFILADLVVDGSPDAEKEYDAQLKRMAANGVPPLSLSQEKEYNKRVSTLIRNKNRQSKRKPKKQSTGSILTKYWLALSLWNKSTGEIRASMPELQTGQDQADHERDCKKIEKAIRDHNLLRIQ